MPRKIKLLILNTLFASLASVLWAAGTPSHGWLQFATFLAAILLSSGLKVALPAGEGTMSLNFPFVLLAIVQLSPLQAILLAALSVAAQCRIRVKKLFTAVQIAFNIGSTICATTAAVFTYTAASRLHVPLAPALAIAAIVYYLCTTLLVATVIAWSKGERVFQLWRAEFVWYGPFYIVGAVLAAVASLISSRFGWATSMLLIPMVYTVFRSYTAQMARIKEREQHLKETESLHLRIIEALAMAIEAKDRNTHEHLFRVRTYVDQIGRALNLSAVILKALHTASFLHDIGKLAVPEHIVNKPGKLTPGEFEKMKIHPVVGADILERVRFPYPVVPIVRSHHEWWDGSGYPDGLKGEAIPIGARILSVVDCFDALTSDRPYRKGQSLEESMRHLELLAGTQFDPAVVAAFRSTCMALAEPTLDENHNFIPLDTQINVWRGEAPGAGFESNGALRLSDEVALAGKSFLDGDPVDGTSSLNLIAAASQEAQTLFELSQNLGGSLSLKETVSVMASRMKRLIEFDCCALYLRRGNDVVAHYVEGACAADFSAQPIPLGEGISGWVAQNGKPLLNGNAGVEPSYHRQAELGTALRSALSIPLFNLEKEVFAVLTLYAVDADSFSRDHLRIMQAMESKLSLSLQNALHHRRAEVDAETDYLTNLPNARRLFVQLETEVERCRTAGNGLAVIVCDLNSFKEVNDQFGHLTGNILLSAIASELRANCRPFETIARMGGDEFVFLIPGLTAESAPPRLQLIAASVAKACWSSGLETRVSASLGISFYPSDGQTAEALLACADRFMYLDKQAHYKQAGSNNGNPITSTVAA
jgi:diguanylate cyclase (GGDEF)-like protein/putative nucleotidyltransferase with HDIG domain